MFSFAEYPGIDGFLGGRGSFMLDLVVVAMWVVVPALAWSIYEVRVRRNFRRHKRIQVVLASALTITVLLFEIEMRVSGWVERARPSPYFGTGEGIGIVHAVLWVHLFFAITSALLWIVVVAAAIRRFPVPPRPDLHSAFHRRWGRIAAADMVLTAVTGWLFYWLAFVARP